jgi:hypothetical protein
LELVKRNTPEGHTHFIHEGPLDHLCNKVDVATGEIVDHVPDQPTDDHQWHEPTKRWNLSAAVQAKEQARAQALATINQLEAQCVRPLRELALGIAGAADRLAALETAIAAERLKL